MSVIESDALGRAQEFQHGGKGPVTASRHRRNAVIYALLCVAALTPAWLDASAAWQTAGLGLFLPGGGFFALGGGWLLMVPVVLALFWVSCIAWFWSGMVVAPLTVWLGSAALAGSLAGEAIWAPGMALAPMAAAGIFLWAPKLAGRRLTDGIGCDGYVWKYLLPSLAKERAVVHWHYRGHGKTPLPRDPDRVSVADCAALTEAFPMMASPPQQPLNFGVFLAFAGHFVLADIAGGAVMHFAISLLGILIMSGMAWVISWYKRYADKGAKKGTIGNADMAGGSL